MTNAGSHMSASPDVQRVVCEVDRLIDLDSAELDDEFFPAHLTVALIDAVFNPRLDYKKLVVPIVERYCARFGLRRVRRDRMSLPSLDEQETLTDLINHYEVLGESVMQDEIFRSRHCSPRTTVRKSDNVRHAAVELRKVGVETIQQVESKTPQEIEGVLRPLHGIGPMTIRMLLTYSGNEDLVMGGGHVCRFVAKALGAQRVAPEQAERLVADAARALGVAPRLLDNEIWRYGNESRGR